MSSISETNTVFYNEEIAFKKVKTGEIFAEVLKVHGKTCMLSLRIKVSTNYCMVLGSGNKEKIEANCLVKRVEFTELHQFDS